MEIPQLVGFLILVLLLGAIAYDNVMNLFDISRKAVGTIWDLIKAPYTIGNYFFSLWWNYEDNYEKYLENKRKFVLEQSKIESEMERPPFGSTPEKLSHKFDSNLAQYDLSTDKNKEILLIKTGAKTFSFNSGDNHIKK